MAKKPPSRIRYERSHPVISARVDKDTYDKLQEMVKGEGRSLASFLKDFVRKKRKRWDGAYRRGAKDNRIWYFCAVCGEKMYMMPGDKDHQSMIKYMKEHGWGHSECHEKD